jgi:hypothetical protein
MSAKCPACLLNEDPGALGFTAAYGAMMSTACGWNEIHYCPLHRLDVKKMAEAAAKGHQHRKLVEAFRVITGGRTEPTSKGRKRP